MCEAPIEEDFLCKDNWNNSIRIGEDEGAISKPNAKEGVHGKQNSLETYNSNTRYNFPEEFGSLKSKTRLDSSFMGRIGADYSFQNTADFMTKPLDNTHTVHQQLN